MARQWDADFEIEMEQARDLIAAQFPSLTPPQLELLGVGWDNVAFLVNARYVFRFPRRNIAIKLIEYEARILPRIAPYLPLSIPVPVFVGNLDSPPLPQWGRGGRGVRATFPYPFIGYEMIPGTPACRVALSEEARARNAVPLARFLSALHSIPIDAETLAKGPDDEIERANLLKRLPQIEQKLQNIAPKLPELDIASLLTLFRQLASAPRLKPPCWVHGDLYTCHLLVDEAHNLCGVIDWGDVHLGDPAIDLMIAFLFLPPPARSAFRQAYGDIDEATWNRARFRALHYGVTLFEYGDEMGDEPIRAAGDYALRNTSL